MVNYYVNINRYDTVIVIARESGRHVCLCFTENNVMTIISFIVRFVHASIAPASFLSIF